MFIVQAFQITFVLVFQPNLPQNTESQQLWKTQKIPPGYSRGRLDVRQLSGETSTLIFYIDNQGRLLTFVTQTHGEASVPRCFRVLLVSSKSIFALKSRNTSCPSPNTVYHVSYWWSNAASFLSSSETLVLLRSRNVTSNHFNLQVIEAKHRNI